jgi:hypothetical protein
MDPLQSLAWTALDIPGVHTAPAALRQIDKPKPKWMGHRYDDSDDLMPTQDNRVDDNDDIEVDTDCDTPYIINAREDSFNASLAAEDDPDVRETLSLQAVLALKQLKRAQELADQLQHSPIAPETGGSSAAQVDLLLRNIVRRIKKRLQSGGSLILECLRLEADGVVPNLVCAYPLCPSPDHKIPPCAYYIIVGLPHDLQEAQHYCLFCLEDLWDGKGMIGLPPRPDIETLVSLEKGLDGLSLKDEIVRDSASRRFLIGDCDACQHHVMAFVKNDHLLQGDGPQDFEKDSHTPGSFYASELMQSKHAPKPNGPELEWPETPGGPYSPEPPTRFQKLAEFLRSGESLDEAERQAVTLWRICGDGYCGRDLSAVLGGFTA